ncbi:MAG: aldehyde dehydrogenase [Flavobacteriaceae bacterium]|nr:aldehyde dehydrogenase [Flavobacteriaceae bacterium]
MKYNSDIAIDILHKKQKIFFNSQVTQSNSFRIKKLKGLKKEINFREKDIYEALKRDLGKSEFESMTSEIVLVEKEITKMIKMLPIWNRPHRTKSSLVNFPSKDYLIPEPYGNTLIISPWNYPFQLAVTPLVGAIAAGNTVVLKPSEFAPYTCELIKEIIKNVFDEGHVAVLEGDGSVASDLLQKKWDYIMFTGSTSIGKIVAKAAAEHLTPTTLELGGKSPCVIDKTPPIGITAKRLVWGKFLNCGQTCIAPDYILVHEDIKEKLIQKVIHQIEKAFGKNQQDSEDYGRIAHKNHFNRLKKSLENQNVIYGGQMAEKELFFGPTLVDNPPLISELMQEEIFGPILPIISYKEEEEIHKILEKRERPLAFYVFSKRKKFIDQLFKRYSFGGGVANDSIIHFANDNLPFGGVGHSGMGAYHGKFSFKNFSHYKPVIKRAYWFDIPGRYAPYPKSLSLLKLLLKNL